MSLPLPVMDPCYFCEIIAGRSDTWSVIEQTDLVVTMLNGRQLEVGQCLVVPVRHAATILDLNEHEESALMAAAKRLTAIMVKAFSPDGVLLYQNNGVGSGQEVPHFHMHVVPRRGESDWGMGPPHIARLEQDKRPAHLRHDVVTEAKREVVEDLRRHYRRKSLSRMLKDEA